MSGEINPVLKVSHRKQRGLPSAGLPKAQQGVALVVALILLVVITLVGLAAVRGTIIQQKMASNMFDRQVAFQNAEAALRAAQAVIQASPASITRNCQSPSVTCGPNPFDDNTIPVVDVTTAQYTKGALAESQPQYIIENMGAWQDPSSDTGFNQSANSHNYGVNGGSSTAIYYRVTARSGAPGAAGDRAVVVLQAMLKG